MLRSFSKRVQNHFALINNLNRYQKINFKNDTNKLSLILSISSTRVFNEIQKFLNIHYTSFICKKIFKKKVQGLLFYTRICLNQR